MCLRKGETPQRQRGVRKKSEKKALRVRGGGEEVLQVSEQGASQPPEGNPRRALSNIYNR